MDSEDTINSFIAKIRNNDPQIDTLHLTDPTKYTPAEFESLLAALERNTTIQTLRLHQSVLTRLNVDLPTRQRLYACAKRLGCSLKVTAFACCFSQLLGPQTLVYLKFSNLVLNGRSSVLRFANALRRCVHLKVFKVRSHIPIQLRRQRLTDAILLALASCNQLEEVRINARTTCSLSNHAIQRMLQGATSLKKLFLVNMHLGAEHITSVLQNLPPTIRSVALGYIKHYPASNQQWGQFFASNHPMTKLKVICQGAPDVLSELNKALTSGRNTTLQHFKAKEIRGTSVDPVVSVKTEFELLLNRKGKKHWLNSPDVPATLLPLVLKRGRNEDPSFLYHWLQRSVPEIANVHRDQSDSQMQQG
jgi:hypothetical protein